MRLGMPENHTFLWENAWNVWHLVFPSLGAERGLSGGWPAVSLSLSCVFVFFLGVLSLRGKYPHFVKRGRASF